MRRSHRSEERNQGRKQDIPPHEKYGYEFETPKAKYIFVDQVHDQRDKEVEELVGAVDAVVLESNVDFGKYGDFGDFYGALLENQEYEHLLPVIRSAGIPIFLTDLVSRSILHFFLNLTVEYLMLFLTPSVYVTAVSRELRLKPFSSYFALTRFYTIGAARSAHSAGKIEEFIVPELKRRLGAKPTVLIYFGGGHEDMIPYLRYSKLRHFAQLNPLPFLFRSRGNVNKVLEISFGDVASRGEDTAGQLDRPAFHRIHDLGLRRSEARSSKESSERKDVVAETIEEIREKIDGLPTRLAPDIYASVPPNDPLFLLQQGLLHGSRQILPIAYELLDRARRDLSNRVLWIEKALVEMRKAQILYGLFASAHVREAFLQATPEADTLYHFRSEARQMIEVQLREKISTFSGQKSNRSIRVREKNIEVPEKVRSSQEIDARSQIRGETKSRRKRLVPQLDSDFVQVNAHQITVSDHREERFPAQDIEAQSTGFKDSEDRVGGPRVDKRLSLNHDFLSMKDQLNNRTGNFTERLIGKNDRPRHRRASKAPESRDKSLRSRNRHPDRPTVLLGNFLLQLADIIVQRYGEDLAARNEHIRNLAAVFFDDPLEMMIQPLVIMRSLLFMRHSFSSSTYSKDSTDTMQHQGRRVVGRRGLGFPLQDAVVVVGSPRSEARIEEFDFTQGEIDKLEFRSIWETYRDLTLLSSDLYPVVRMGSVSRLGFTQDGNLTILGVPAVDAGELHWFELDPDKAVQQAREFIDFLKRQYEEQALRSHEEITELSLKNGYISWPG